MLDLVPVGAGQQQPQWALCAGVTFWPLITHLLPRLSARVTGPPCRAAAGLAEQLAPGVLAGEDALQELLLMQVGAVRGMVAAASVWMPALATPTAPTLANSSSTTALNFTGRSRPNHSFGQCGAPQPDSQSFSRHSTRPSRDSTWPEPARGRRRDAVFREFNGVGHGYVPRARPGLHLSRCWLASPNRISLDLALNQRWVSLSQVKLMPCICTAWMAVVDSLRCVPWRATPAPAGRRRPRRAPRRSRPPTGSSRSPYVGRLVLGGLERGDRAAELHAHLDVFQRILAQPVGAAHHLCWRDTRSPAASSW